ncbi:grb10 interacting GYF protein, putative [Eimeria mitis]|uniref:Grb10 interacting GYF protein, putative n=1 Tax=Eimeria mitis TaxID=44415 RepID=U6K3P2_9EIME|nr:grb10 interacting GYF protein, putative [Eimeria mitis]CDJ30942.1 grb10 interacting GYF protein, putative [Eimeria mitis]
MELQSAEQSREEEERRREEEAALRARKDSNGQSVAGWGTPGSLGGPGAPSVGSSEDFPDLLEGATNPYSSGAATPSIMTPAGGAAGAPVAAAATPAAGGATGAAPAAAVRAASLAGGSDATTPAATRKGGGGSKGKLKGNTQSLQDFIASAAPKKDNTALPLGATAWSQGAPKGLAASVPPPTPMQQQQLQQQQLQQQQLQRTAPTSPVKKSVAASRSSGPSSSGRPADAEFPSIPAGPSAAATEKDAPKRAPAQLQAAATEKDAPKRAPAQLQEWNSLLAECELPLDVPILEYLATMDLQRQRQLVLTEWNSLLAECELPLDVPILEYLATMDNPLEVEEFLLESFPSHKNLRLFAENFVMTNDKYNKRPQDEKGGPQGVLVCLFPL